MIRGRSAGGRIWLCVSALVLLVASACSNGTDDATSPFHPKHGSLKVDTPVLRSLKAAAGIAPCPVTGSGSGVVGGGLPALTLPCLGGGRDVELAGLRGPLVINLWSQTCGPCRDEAPLLQQLWATARQEVRVVGLDFYDPQPGLALEFARAHGLTYPQVADPEASAKADLHVAALPMTLFVDSTGRIAYTQVGPIQSATELRDLLREHLGVDVPAMP